MEKLLQGPFLWVILAVILIVDIILIVRSTGPARIHRIIECFFTLVLIGLCLLALR